MDDDQPMILNFEPLRTVTGEDVFLPDGSPIFTPSEKASAGVAGECPDAALEVDNIEDAGGAGEPDWREDVLARFRAWLYELTDDGSPEFPERNDNGGESSDDDDYDDEGIEADAPDMYTLLAEITALKQESRMQARGVRHAERAVTELADNLRMELRGQSDKLAAAAADLKAQLPAARRDGWMAVMTEFLNVRETLEQSVSLVEGMDISNLPWLRGNRAVLREAKRSQRLCLDKADDALRRLGVRPAVEIGQTFDPRHMRAVTVVAGTGAMPGTVTRVLRQGWLKDEDILQIAEVEVGK